MIQKNSIRENIVRGQVKHLACIMDGNRRFAQAQGWVPWYGHKEGVEAVRRTVAFCLEKNVSYLSLYTFSLENFRRSPEENGYLFGLMAKEAEKSIEEFKEMGIKVSFIGNRSLFPAHLMPICERVEKETVNGTQLTLNFLFCYGSQQELVAGMQALAHRVKAGDINPEDIKESLLREHLWMGAIPEPDIIIRTGGHKRLSNFLLYQAAYSELFFLDCLWPEFSQKHLHEVFQAYAQQVRNFGT